VPTYDIDAIRSKQSPSPNYLSEDISHHSTRYPSPKQPSFNIDQVLDSNSLDHPSFELDEPIIQSSNTNRIAKTSRPITFDVDEFFLDSHNDIDDVVTIGVDGSTPSSPVPLRSRLLHSRNSSEDVETLLGYAERLVTLQAKLNPNLEAEQNHPKAFSPKKWKSPFRDKDFLLTIGALLGISIALILTQVNVGGSQ
jgi:hypothetical protein